MERGFEVVEGEGGEGKGFAVSEKKTKTLAKAREDRENAGEGSPERVQTTPGREEGLEKVAEGKVLAG